VATIGGEPGGRAPIVVEDKLGQDAAVPPQDDFTTAIPIGVAEPGRDIFAKGEQKEIKSQMLAFDVPDVVDDEKEISLVKFEPTHAAPKPESSEKEEDKMDVGDVSNSAGAGEPEPLGDAEVFGNLQEVMDEVGDDSDKLRVSHGPLDHEEAIADQVAHELYPEARDAE
jgi:dolichyl-phosphate-mannose-protein mannosyltransferase